MNIPWPGREVLTTEDGRQVEVIVTRVVSDPGGWSATVEVNGKIDPPLPGGALVTWPDGARGRIVSQVVNWMDPPRWEADKWHVYMPGLSTQSLVIRGSM